MMRIPVLELVQIFLASASIMQHQDFDPTTHPSWHLVNDRTCGRQPVMRIFGGQNARLGEFPWMVLVLADKINLKTEENLSITCGGSILSKKYVLSAAHCFADAKHSYSNIRFRVGEYDLTGDPDCDSAGICAPSIMEYPAAKVTLHPDYNINDPDSYNPLADIAVARIEGEFVFSDFVSPICLEYGDLLKQDYAGEIAQTIGWGAWGLVGNETQTPDILQKVSLDILDLNICTQILMSLPTRADQIPESHICAGTQTQFSYSGDSGSPMFVAKSVDGDIPRQYQIGVFVELFHPDETVWHGGKRPNGYTRVSYFLNWILDQMQD